MLNVEEAPTVDTFKIIVYSLFNAELYFNSGKHLIGPNSIHETGGEHNYHFDERIDVKLDNNVIVACEGMYFNAYDDSISGLYGENDENNIRILL